MIKILRKFSSLLFVLLLVFTPLLSFAESVTFKLSATIPAIPGVNVPPFDTGSQTDKPLLHYSDNAWDASQEEVWNSGEKVILVTVLEK